MADIVLYEVKDRIAYITMNRPEKLNALNDEMVAELSRTWDRFEADPAARVAILSGAGKAFCGGADITPGALAPLVLEPPLLVELFEPTLRDLLALVLRSHGRLVRMPT